MKIGHSIKHFFTKPSAKYGFGLLITVGIVIGILGWSSFNTIIDKTSEETFCVSCHSMQQPLEELKQTAHWSNKSGVSATCSDCHLPHEGLDKYARKFEALRELWAEMSGKYNESGAFEKHRLEMAEREWARFEKDGSKQCKACHSYEKMDFDKMSEQARKAMLPAKETNQSCMDCHKGIAHHLPKQTQSSGNTSKFDHLVTKSLTDAKTYYTKGTVRLFSDEALTQNIGQLETAVPVKFIKSSKGADLVELAMWRKNKGFGRIWYHQFGKNITDAVLSKEFMSNEPQFSVIETKDDPITGLTWQKVTMQVWVAKANLVEDLSAIWANAESIYKTQCSTCHRQPEVAHFDSNSWIGLFNGMVGFTNIDKETGKEVLRYLQLHSSDFEQHNENK